MRSFLFSLIFLFCGRLQSQTSFVAVAESEKMRPGNLLEVSFILKDAEGEDFIAPNFSKDFYVLSGPNRGLSTIIQNGQMQREMSFAYTLQPIRSGKLTIPPARIKVRGKTLKSNPLVIHVTDEGKPENVDQDFFIRAEISQNNIYPGQQVRLDYKIYTRREIQNYSILKESDYEGFYASDIQRIDPTVQTTQIKGKTYYTKTLRSIALYPQQSGKQTIAPFILQVGLLEEDSQRPGSIFFRGDVSYVNLESNPLTIIVKDLPKPIPEPFHGAVGSFTVSAEIDKTTASANEPFFLNISLLGDGDVKRIKSPSLNLPPELLLYDTKSEEEEKGENEGKKFSRKSFTYTLQPQKEGAFRFQATFTGFNPQTGTFETKTLDPILLHITAGKTPDLKRREEKSTFIPLTKADFQQPSPLNTFFRVLGLILPFFLGVFYFLYRFLNQKKKIQSPYEISMHHFRQAKIFGTDGDFETCFIELSFGLRTFLFHQFDIPKENISNEQIINRLLEKGVSNQDALNSLGQLLSLFEMVLYAPSMKKEQWETIWNEAYQLLNQLK
jgi:hypothetical protein